MEQPTAIVVAFRYGKIITYVASGYNHQIETLDSYIRIYYSHVITYCYLICSLSHSSIVAREYHIPAVLGTGAATGRLSSGQRVTVDGDAGTVKVSSEE
jgi:hypothetical protein